MKRQTEQLTVRFDSTLAELLEAYAEYTSQPKAVAARDALLEGLLILERERPENPDRERLRGSFRRAQ